MLLCTYFIENLVWMFVVKSVKREGDSPPPVIVWLMYSFKDNKFSKDLQVVTLEFCWDQTSTVKIVA